MKLSYPTEWSNEMRPVMSGISVIYPTGLDKIQNNAIEKIEYYTR
jgi:hypothetical protein